MSHTDAAACKLKELVIFACVAFSKVFRKKTAAVCVWSVSVNVYVCLYLQVPVHQQSCVA